MLAVCGLGRDPRDRRQRPRLGRAVEVRQILHVARLVVLMHVDEAGQGVPDVRDTGPPLPLHLRAMIEVVGPTDLMLVQQVRACV